MKRFLPRILRRPQPQKQAQPQQPSLRGPAQQKQQPQHPLTFGEFIKMVRELDVSPLTQADREYVESVKTILDIGGEIAPEVVKLVRQIYDRTKVVILPEQPINLSMILQMIQELENAMVMILKEEDRAYVQGVKMLIDMEEVVTPEAMLRIKQIHDDFKKVEHKALEER